MATESGALAFRLLAFSLLKSPDATSLK